ncbi:MAG TPA: Ada metal-binding domain-containing protein [Actinomycetota bacterium]|nr:Ada metal-binding domain-containing protein [Actinomycetota bacterium]
MTGFEACYRAVVSRDARFDGRFFTAVTSTRIYCRPICPARTPKRANLRFYAHAAAAEEAGFRPCKRCMPEASPDSPEWDVRADLVGRALRLIADGVADTDGVTGVAERLCVGERHLRRLFLSEVGAPPLAVARSRRARLARQLLSQTDLSMSHIAFASGFASVRSFNHCIKDIYGVTPTEVRRGRAPLRPGELSLKLAYRPPLDAPWLLTYLAGRAFAGVEEVVHGVFRRAVRVGDGFAVVELEPASNGVVQLRVRGESVPIAPIVQAARRALDLDADPHAIAEVLNTDPQLASLLSARPGIRLAGAFDGFEVAIRAVLGQQVSVKAATTMAARLIQRAGTRITVEEEGEETSGLTHLFPTPEALASTDLSGLGLPGSKMKTLNAIAAAVATGDVLLDGRAEPDEVRAQLLNLPGIGPWTASYISMRVLRDPDAFPSTDLGLVTAAQRLGIASNPKELEERSEQWRPWRGYSAMLLWSSLS